MQVQFREEIEEFLEKLPFDTQCGSIAEYRSEAQFGFRTGFHSPVHLWVYLRNNSNLALHFGFYKNFTNNDLICKIVQRGVDISPGEGASIQFNANNSLRRDHSGAIWLQHEGRFTAKGKGIKRAVIIQAIGRVAPEVLPVLGSVEFPYQIGSTSDIAALLDSLFAYAYAIEQAKRSLRDERPLPSFPI